MISSSAVSQPSVEKIPIPLSDPNRPAFLKVGLLSGGIVVRGTAGKEVVVEAMMPPEEEDHDREKKGGTLKLIPNTSLGLTAEEEDNTVTISTGLRGVSRRIDLVIQVPTACSMKLSTVNEGDIEVENVSGDLEINNTNGSITLKQIAGSAVAQTLNGGVHVVFTRVNPDKAMSFSSMNGDIDVTFPAALKASLQLKSEQGDIFTDFNMQLDKTTARVDKNDKGKGKFRVTVEKVMRGTVNGGGQEIQFTNFNGDIFIRKGN
jgi:DUF4097 and DUF4098 domain-containing protein YvlB